MKKTELILGAIAIISFILNLFLVPGGAFFTVISFLALSIFYFLCSFALFNNIKLKSLFKGPSNVKISPLRIIGGVGTGFAISYLIIGILFKIQGYPGAGLTLLVGLVLSLIIGIVSLIKYFMNKSDFYTGIIKRIIIYGCFGLIIYLLPSRVIFEFKYRNYPEYVDSFEKMMDDPENIELREKF